MTNSTYENALNTLPQYIRQPVDRFDLNILRQFSGSFSNSGPAIIPVSRCGWNGEGVSYKASIEYLSSPVEAVASILQRDTADGRTGWIDLSFDESVKSIQIGCDRPSNVSFAHPYFRFGTSALGSGGRPPWPIPRSNDPWDCIGIGSIRHATGVSNWIVNRNLLKSMLVVFKQEHLDQTTQIIGANCLGGVELQFDYEIISVSYWG